MKRRAFLSVVAGGLLAAPLAAEAQPGAGKMPRIGWLSGPVPAQPNSKSFKTFTEGLREAGYIIGQNVIIDVRTPGDKVEQYPELATRLVTEGVDIIVAVNPLSLDAVTKATKTIPIVALDTESDPVARGWVASLSRPGRNVTGFFLDFPEVSGKQLQFLKEVKPTLTRVAVLGDARVNELQFQATEVAARQAGLQLERLLVKDASEIPGAIAGAAHRGTGALLALTSPVVNTHLHRIADLAIKHRLPAICFFARFSELGGLFTYGADFQSIFRPAAAYVARILKGDKPAELPVQRPAKFDLVINLKTAKTIGLTIPPALLQRADEVIQ